MCYLFTFLPHRLRLNNFTYNSRTIQIDDKLKYLTINGGMEELKTLTIIKYSNCYGQVFTEATPTQRHIMKVFDVELQTYLHRIRNSG